MALYMIATLRNSISDIDNIIGIRLFDTETGQKKDVPMSAIKKSMTSPSGIVIENLGIDANKEIIGINGHPGNYAKFVRDVGLVGKSSGVITKVYLNREYQLVNGLGQSDRVSHSTLLNYAMTEGIANAHIDFNTGYVKSVGKDFEREVRQTGIRRDTNNRIDMHVELDIKKGEVRVKNANQKVKELEYKQNLIYNDEYSQGTGQRYEISPDGVYNHLDTSAKKVIVPNGVVSLGVFAFKGCINLEEVVLPNTIRNLGISAFAQSPRLKKLVIPSGFEAFTGVEFTNCSVEELYIPSTLKLCGGALRQLRNLKIVYLENKSLLNIVQVRPGVKKKVL